MNFDKSQKVYLTLSNENVRYEDYFLRLLDRAQRGNFGVKEQIWRIVDLGCGDGQKGLALARAVQKAFPEVCVSICLVDGNEYWLPDLDKAREASEKASIGIEIRCPETAANHIRLADLDTIDLALVCHVAYGPRADHGLQSMLEALRQAGIPTIFTIESKDSDFAILREAVGKILSEPIAHADRDLVQNTYTPGEYQIRRLEDKTLCLKNVGWDSLKDWFLDFLTGYNGVASDARFIDSVPRVERVVSEFLDQRGSILSIPDDIYVIDPRRRIFSFD